MKRRFIYVLAAILCVSTAFSAEDKTLPSDEELDYSQLVSEIQEVRAPYLDGDYVIFTAPHTARHVGIAFDFENFRTIHSYKIKKFTDMEYKDSGSLLFYILKLPKNILSVNYRLVIDGLWTTDPVNENKIFSRDANLTLSHVDASRNILPMTENIKKDTVRFVYRGKSGQQIRVGGSFTNWDSWIYQMTEVSPGLYELELPLPPGQYEYAFYTGITSFPDNTNPQKCYTPDGRTASLLIVK